MNVTILKIERGENMPTYTYTGTGIMGFEVDNCLVEVVFILEMIILSDDLTGLISDDCISRYV